MTPTRAAGFRRRRPINTSRRSRRGLALIRRIWQRCSRTSAGFPRPILVLYEGPLVHADGIGGARGADVLARAVARAADGERRGGDGSGIEFITGDEGGNETGGAGAGK